MKENGRPKAGLSRARESMPPGGPVHPMFQLQKQVGNQAVLDLLRCGGVQAKQAISNPNDTEEREADRVVDHVMRADKDYSKAAQCPCMLSGGELCEECKQKRSMIPRRAAGSGTPTAIPKIVRNVLHSPGRALDAATRAFFEPRFGQDFSHVRVHTGAEAEASTRSISALAYTAGEHVVFGAGQYAPRSDDGRRLLAHELTHVVQQSENGRRPERSLSDPDEPAEREARDVSQHVTSGMGVSNPKAPSAAAVLRQETPPATDTPLPLTPGAPPVLRRDVDPKSDTEASGSATANCLVHFVRASTDFTDPAEFPTCIASIKAFLDGDESRSVELSGFASEEGDAKFNADLAQRRADTVKALLVRGGVPVAKLTAVGRGVDMTYAKLEDNRRVEVVNPPAPLQVQVQEIQITGINCPPSKTVKALSLSDYVALMSCAETKLGLSPREMLTTFRQLYYGSQAWSIASSPVWDDVVRCPASVGDPQPKLGKELFDSLQASQEVGGVDVGHVFVGLESMMCPTANVPVTKGGWKQSLGALFGATTVDMPNEDFATWGGDLGAAVAARAACERLGAGAATNEDCFKIAGPQSLSFYLRNSAPDQDLQGDIDPFALRAQALGIPCGGSAQRTAAVPAGKLSDVFDAFYNDSGSALGKAHANNVRCFLDAIGAQLDPSGKRITNRDAIVGPLQANVASFAEAFYYKIIGSLPDSGEVGKMKIVYAAGAVNWFLDWLERRLP